MIYQFMGVDDACSLGFCPVTSELSDWLSISSDSGFIRSLSSVEVVQEFWNYITGMRFGWDNFFVKRVAMCLNWFWGGCTLNGLVLES